MNLKFLRVGKVSGKDQRSLFYYSHNKLYSLILMRIHTLSQCHNVIGRTPSNQAPTETRPEASPEGPAIGPIQGPTAGPTQRPTQGPPTTSTFII